MHKRKKIVTRKRRYNSYTYNNRSKNKNISKIKYKYTQRRKTYRGGVGGLDDALIAITNSTTDAVEKLTGLWKEVEVILENYTIEKWENETVSLFINDKLFASMPRTNMLWFFFFDIVHHRGQLSSYVRPMGGKNPAVYGYSADTSKI